MNSNENAHNGLSRNGGGFTEEASDAEGNEHLSFEADEKEKVEADELESARRRTRKRWIGWILMLLALAAAGAALWIVFDRRNTKIHIPIRDNTKKIDQSMARDNNDSNMTAQAIAEVRSAVSSPAPVPSVSPVPAARATGANVGSTAPVTIPMDPVGNATRPPTMETATGHSGASSGAADTARRGEITSQRNPELSIRCAPTPTPVLTSRSADASLGNLPSAESILLRRAESPISLPSFGALLPVRTLGAIYTLRQNLARFELTRDVIGNGWMLKRGTVMVGQQQGSEQNRAYVNLTGFIDPVSGKLVRLSGDTLGADGAPGLEGKIHRVNSTWKRVLDRAATSGVALAQAALSRGNTTTVVLPGAVAPELAGITSTNRREFVEVPAASPAYILITRLPEQAQGIDATPAPAPPAGDFITAIGNPGGAISDDEVAALIESGSPEQIRAAMPRMSPELRRVAEMVLKEQNK